MCSSFPLKVGCSVIYLSLCSVLFIQIRNTVTRCHNIRNNYKASHNYKNTKSDTDI
jgi:hypothetical protein